MHERISPETYKRWQESCAELELRPSRKLVITGLAAATNFGNTAASWEGLKNGQIGIEPIDTPHPGVKLGSPDKFDVNDYIHPRDQKYMAETSSMASALSKEAMQDAGLHDGKNLYPHLNPDRAAAWIGSGIGSTLRFGQMQELLYHSYKEEKDPYTGATYKTPIPPSEQFEKISSREGHKIYPEETVGQPSIYLGLRGSGGSSAEACATGAGNIAEAADKFVLEKRKLDVAVTGGLDRIHAMQHEFIEGTLGKIGVLSESDDPKSADRPFDEDPSGFVIGSGGAVMVLEDIDHALRRGAKIYAELLGWYKSMDGKSPIMLDYKNVARTIRDALTYRTAPGEIPYKPNVVFAHAAGSKGDVEELKAYHELFQDEAYDIHFTAIKSMIGHTLGGAGALSAFAAVKAIETGWVPPIPTLHNPAKGAEHFTFVRKPSKLDPQVAVVDAFGLGGQNAVLVFGRYEE